MESSPYDELPPLVDDFRHGYGAVDDALNLLDYDCGTMLRDLETYTEDSDGNTHVDPTSNVSPLHSPHSLLHTRRRRGAAGHCDLIIHL